MKIGDKVRIIKGEYKGLVGTVGKIVGEEVRIDNSRVDVFLWYNESDLEPVMEHKFKVGDKVIDKNFPDTILTVCTVDGDIVEAEPEKYSLPKWTYNAKNLEPISDHMTADELAELITPTEEDEIDKLLSRIPTMSEDEERLIKNARATFDDSDNLITCMKDKELHFGVSKDNIWKDKTYEDGLKEGYKKGFNAGVKQTRDKVVDALFTVVKI